ncbi:hypothetical protein BCR43DRAFT_484180 [Syncephalastrum racemosum]|uniref:DUF202 domain-containing protein n=1 Tax=Syncephalastrum racemosum TaxID=13706 RepID=A0A1X2HWN6_SYNRA|nr:hypothetical protein BCR43DRAFT_484180 [Syncephalastrum racemosum]
MAAECSESAHRPGRLVQPKHSPIWPDIAVIVPNKGSTARDILAVERNFLTFFRLGSTLAVIGFTILLKFRLPTVDEGGDVDDRDDDWSNEELRRPIGIIFVAIGFLSVLVAIGKYFKNQILLIKQKNNIQAGWGSYVTVGILVCFVCLVMAAASLDSSLFSTIPPKN